MRIQGVIDEISEERFDLYEEAGKNARLRLDMKTQYDRVNNQCGERWQGSTPAVRRRMIHGAEPVSLADYHAAGTCWPLLGPCGGSR